MFICVHLWLNFLVPYRANRRKLSTEHQLNVSAQRALMRRAHSIHEMKQYLERRAENKELIPPVIARLREQQPDLWVAHPIDALWASYSGEAPNQKLNTDEHR